MSTSTAFQRLILVLLAVLAAVSRGAVAADPPACPADARWGLVIDAGSSGSRLYVYCWRPAPEGGLPWIENLGSEKRRPGVADAKCSHTPEEAVDGLRPLVAYARETIGDPSRMAATPLAFMATAGLRQCPSEYQERMLAAIRELLAATPFEVVAVKVLSGEDEGRFGWMSVNYLARQAAEAGEASTTLGALELGGASTQITFVPAECPAERTACGQLEFGASDVMLYSHSYLGWGQDAALRTVASPACYLRGYRSPEGFNGRGKYRACKRAIRRAIARQIRRHPPARPCLTSCTRLGAYQPPLQGDFVAFSAFAYTSDFFALPNPLSLRELEAAGKLHCRTRRQEIEAKCAANAEAKMCQYDEHALNRYCFASAYIVTLLHEVYGFPMDTRGITASNELDGIGIDWTLGAMMQMAD